MNPAPNNQPNRHTVCWQTLAEAIGFALLAAVMAYLARHL